MKIIICNSSIGLCLGYKGIMRYAELKGITLYPYISEWRPYQIGQTGMFSSEHGSYKIRIESLNWDRENYVSYLLLPPTNEENLEKGHFDPSEIARNDPILIQTVEELGTEGFAAKLRIIEIPDGIAWQIEEFDGYEWVAEKHRTWGKDT